MSSVVEEPVRYEYVVARQSRFGASLARLWARSPAWAGPVAVAACMGGAVAYTLLDRPVDAAAGPPTCVLKLTTGFDCPGCGGTRAFWYLLQGNVPAAVRHHAMFVFALPFLLYMYVAWAVNTVSKRRRLPMLTLSPRTLSIFLGGWFAFTVLRNLPWAPFTWLFV
jgi:hypothetical protein